jgi:hypothetical protein
VSVVCCEKKICAEVTVTGRPKSTRHHWLLLNCVFVCVSVVPSTASSAVKPMNVLDCAVAHGCAPLPHERAKFALACTAAYVGPAYPALHVQFHTDVEPFADTLVDAHARHAVYPTPSEYVFAAQPSHAHAPDTALYLPGTHPVHGNPFGPVNPALHEQFVTFTLASADDEYAGHVVHAHAPVVFLYLPTSHSTHGPPPGPVYPTLHAQSTTRPLAAGAAVFAGHTSQTELPSGDHIPSGHGRHVSFTAAW